MKRPHRHLCSEADYRDGLSDTDFWAHVYGSWQDAFDPDDTGLPRQFDGEPCPECGEAGACTYDVEGRPLIHVISDDDKEES